MNYNLYSPSTVPYTKDWFLIFLKPGLIYSDKSEILVMSVRYEESHKEFVDTDNCVWSINDILGWLPLPSSYLIETEKTIQENQSFVTQKNLITDKETKLIWTSKIWKNKTFDEALELAQELNKDKYLGFFDWRIPTCKELYSLVDSTKYGPASKFPDMPSLGFWSSSPYVGTTNYVWRVNFKYGSAEPYPKINIYSVRCVRDGQ